MYVCTYLIYTHIGNTIRTLYKLLNLFNLDVIQYFEEINLVIKSQIYINFNNQLNFTNYNTLIESTYYVYPSKKYSEYVRG